MEKRGVIEEGITPREENGQVQQSSKPTSSPRDADSLQDHLLSRMIKKAAAKFHDVTKPSAPNC